MTMSDSAASLRTISCASGFCRSSVTLFLLPFTAMKAAAMLRSAHSRDSGVRGLSPPPAPLDLDPLGTQQGQLVARVRPCEHLREVEDTDTLERTRVGNHAAFS